jgi:hypothetical protein
MFVHINNPELFNLLAVDDRILIFSVIPYVILGISRIANLYLSISYVNHEPELFSRRACAYAAPEGEDSGADEVAARASAERQQGNTFFFQFSVYHGTDLERMRGHGHEPDSLRQTGTGTTECLPVYVILTWGCSLVGFMVEKSTPVGEGKRCRSCLARMIDHGMM